MCFSAQICILLLRPSHIKFVALSKCVGCSPETGKPEKNDVYCPEY